MKKIISILTVAFLFIFGQTDSADAITGKSDSIDRQQVIDLLRSEGIDGTYLEDHYSLTYRIFNIDSDERPELLVAIHGGVHIGKFIVFKQTKENKLKSIAAKDWKVENWDFDKGIDGGLDLANSLQCNGKTLYWIKTRTGGTGASIEEEHLVYFENDALVEAWTGTTKEQVYAPDDTVYEKTGAFRMDPMTGHLYYWQTSSTAKDDRRIETPKTTLTIYQFDGKRFIPVENLIGGR
ncbi:hypothetical protein GTO91_03430 [Heliobacterium undosum]|uniref:Uncharacterized protein n=1 Tax=Heliomicrobium undosum TaxID=121734 RepID=A0A845L2L9_9FIRM|nr:hypothetical protein [Heliomicrobium undosum]MZP28760.1 hypothetical protein [Heliomicrobium undosum]